MRRTPLAVALIGIACLSATARAADPPKVWAVVVGIDKYEDNLIPRCNGAARNARAVADWLAGTAGWGESAVLRLNDFGARDHGPAQGKSPELFPSLANLNWAVTDWLAGRAGPDDVVVIYFAGQATARPPQPGASAGRAYLLPGDARSADVAATGWSLDDALDRAGIARKARVVIWLDTSTRGRGLRGIPVEDGAPSGLDWLRALTRWEGVTAWLAADGRPEPEDGAFVAALLPAMGRPDRAHNLLGCLNALRDDKALAARGFRTMGGVGPAVSLWTAGVRVLEKAVPELIVQAGHGDRVTSALVTADGARAITAGEDSTVRVWKLAEGEPAILRTLSDPFIGVKALALDRDGRLLLAGDGAGGIVGWDMAEDRPRPLFGPPRHDEPIAALAFLGDGLGFVSLDQSGRSILWDGNGGAIRHLRPFSADPITRIAAPTRPAAGAPALVAAVEGPDGASSLRAFDARGGEVARFEGPGGRISALGLSPDGLRVAVGDDRGRVVVRNLTGRPEPFARAYRGAIRLARLSGSGLLAVADGRELRLVEAREQGTDVALVDAASGVASGGVARAEFSDDGRWLAACTAVEGRTLAWRLAAPGRPEPVALPESDAAGLSPAFSPDGRLLVLGEQKGGVRAWALEEGPAGPRAVLRSRIRAARGKVAGLSPSPSGRYLLEVTKDDLAVVWDLKQGRGCRPLPGAWSSGAFLPDESRVVLSARGDRRGGSLVVFDREKDAELPTAFARPVSVEGKPLNAAFGRVVASKSGRLVAAASDNAQLPLACVWEVATGKLVHTARALEGGLTALDFSGDEEYLLTASDDGTAKLWPLADPAVELRRAAITFFNGNPDAPAFTAARVCPNDHRRVATGTRGGLVLLWNWDKDKARAERLGDPIPLNGEVNALAFSPDGRWLAASSSNDKSIRFWEVSIAGRLRPVDLKPRPHHAEQVGALAAWTGGGGGPMIVSGGDDAAIRFWDLGGRALVGTLIAQARDTRAGEVRVVDWLAYAPDGRFDGSLRGEAMVKWRVGEKLVTLGQAEDTHYAFRIANAIARGGKPDEGEVATPPPALKAEGPSLKILAPPPVPGVAGREVLLTLWSDTPKPEALRLYQNGVPVRGDDEFDPGETPHFARTRVQLTKGENRFYAMASRRDSADGRSDEVTLNYDGPEPSGQLHTIAIGISGYKNRALKYAHVDARGIADFLRRQGIRGAEKPGQRIVLVDDEVNPERVELEFRRIRAAVKDRPQDTVVLFLAGHTDTDERENQFCLLLPKFPFQPPPAIANVAALDVPDIRIRGDAGGGGVRITDRNVMTYAFLYNQLARIEALQRLVIVDACQAGAIVDDRAVNKIQKNVERGSRKARNSYLLAARRGEPASEVEALEHGLLTYALLAGMGAEGLKPIPSELGGFPGPPSADLNRDGFVTSDELVAYADEALPQLSRLFPQIVVRAGGSLPRAAPGQPLPDLERARLQADQASFPLIVHPAGPK